MISGSINKGSGANNRTGSPASYIWDLVNSLIEDHNKGRANTVNILRYIPPSEWPLIQAKTSTYDCREALLLAINSADAGGSSWHPMGATVICPEGRYSFSQSIEPKRQFGIVGLGTGLTETQPVEFVFPAGVTGIIVNRYNTFQGGVEDTPTGAADASLIHGIRLIGGGYNVGSSVAHGIQLRARTKISSCAVEEFHGNGIHIDAVAGGSDPAREGNANGFRIECVFARFNWGNGLFVDGPDANAGSVVAFNAVYNGQWGIYDSSFLGNGYEHCHTAVNGRRSMVSHNSVRYYVVDESLAGSTEPGTNASVWAYHSDGGTSFMFPAWVNGSSYALGGAYRTDNPNADNCFYSCYSEGDQPPSWVVHPTIVIGGTHGAGFTPSSSALIINRGRISPFRTRPNGAVFDAQVGLRSDEFVALVATGDHNTGLSPFTWSASSGDWVTRHARLDARTPVRYTTDLSTFTGGRSSAVGPGHIRFQRGCFIGDRFVDSGTAAPTTGEWARGDKRLNSAPSAGGFVGWVCTTGGTPGTWKGYGAIEP
jgi:hypothetical protein